MGKVIALGDSFGPNSEPNRAKLYHTLKVGDKVRSGNVVCTHIAKYYTLDQLGSITFHFLLRRMSVSQEERSEHGSPTEDFVW